MIRKPKVGLLMMALGMGLAGAASAQTATQSAPRVFLNGQPFHSDAEPFTQNGRVLVPMRAIFEGLGARVRYNPESGSVSARRGSTNVNMTIGSQAATVNNLNVTLDVPATAYAGRTFVPLRFVSEALGANVDYNFERQVISIQERGPRTGNGGTGSNGGWHNRPGSGNHPGGNDNNRPNDNNHPNGNTDTNDNNYPDQTGGNGQPDNTPTHHRNGGNTRQNDNQYPNQ